VYLNLFDTSIYAHAGFSGGIKAWSRNSAAANPLGGLTGKASPFQERLFFMPKQAGKEQEAEQVKGRAL
jgi:hypothetical protein